MIANRLNNILPPLLNNNKIITFYSYKGGVGRSMALCNIAAKISREHTVNEKSQTKILCVDLDIDAPGIPAYLPPKITNKTIFGFLGLFLQYMEKKKSEDRYTWLQNALNPENNKYIYAVEETDNLFVLPAGNLPPKKRTKAINLLQQILNKVEKPEKPGLALENALFFKDFKKALQECYTYILVDSRTGLADIAFATTALIADTLVLLFRASRTQVLGIKAVLSRFLYEKNLKVTSENIPVIPVLTPRPAYTDPRLAKIREWAASEAFMWLEEKQDQKQESQYSPVLREIIELPYDSSVEIGENLLIPYSSNKKILDKKAPLVKAYIQLANEIQKGNASNDELGIDHLEMKFYHAGNPEQAFPLLLKRIALDPENTNEWQNIWNGYSKHLETNDRSRQLFWQFCDEATKLPETMYIPHFFSNLWQSEIFEKQAPDLCLGKIIQLWEISKKINESLPLKLAIKRVASYFINHTKNKKIKGLPSFDKILTCYALLIIELYPKIIGNIIPFLQPLYSDFPDQKDQLIQVYQDWLLLTTDTKARQDLLISLANRLIDFGMFEYSYKVLKKAADYPNATNEIKAKFVYYALRINDKKLCTKLIQKYIPPYYQSRVTMLLSIRKKESLETVETKLKQLENYNKNLAQEPVFIYYALLNAKKYNKAAQRMEEGIEKDKGDFDSSNLVRLSLAHWLIKDTVFSEALKKPCLSAFQSKNFNPICSLETIIALASSPDTLLKLCEEKLQNPLNYTSNFGFLVLSCISKENYDKYTEKITHYLEENPMLAAYVRRYEDFPLLKIVWDTLFERQKIKKEQYHSFVKVLDMIDTWPVDISREIEPLELDEPITDNNDPRFQEIRDRWISILSPIKEDSELGPIIKIILEEEKPDI